MSEVDLANRDPHDMNNYLQVEYDDIFAEPGSTHSADCVWSNSNKCFTCTKNLCYKILTFLCGICIAFKWGCAFAHVSFCIIWVWGPLLRMLSIILHPVKRVLQIILTTFVGPCIEVYSLIFSRIHVTMSTGPMPRPLGLLDGDEKQNVSQ